MTTTEIDAALLDIAQGLLDEIDRCGVKVSSELESQCRAVVAKAEGTA